MRIQRQLSGRTDDGPVFGDPKTEGSRRELHLSAETVALLREHKKVQAELKLANRLDYKDYGLVFAQAWEQANCHHALLGWPLHANAIATMLERLITETGVRRITVHGLRHTCATLLLAAASNRMSCSSGAGTRASGRRSICTRMSCRRSRRMQRASLQRYSTSRSNAL
jgi:integrase